MPVRMKRALVSRDRNIFAGLKRVGSESRKERTTGGSWPPPMRPIIPVESLTRRHSRATRGTLPPRKNPIYR